MNDSLRLFFGVMLPPDLRQEVAALQQRLAQSGVKVKWVERENLHLTLKFLGDMPSQALPRLEQIGKALAGELEPWDVLLQGVGAFPKPSRPQTLWVGTSEGGTQLTELAESLERRLAQAALAEAERKPFHPHCTLGRVKQEQGVGPLVAAAERERSFAAGPFRCDRFQLLSSTLTSAGPVYRVQAEFHLGRRG